ncbi:MAG: hypothetical protein J0M19_02095 [Sphingomonadales bacterium]|nr:hypothetical protein [Sphingomonadales bacterium]
MQMLNRAALAIRIEGDDFPSALPALDDALLHAAHRCGFWFDDERQRPAALVDGVPIALPEPRRDGECSLAVHRSTREAVATFRQQVIEALAPSPGVSSRRMAQYLDLLARQAGGGNVDDATGPLREAKESGALALAWRLAEIPDARQRPSLSHLERSFAAWIVGQVPDGFGTVIVRERQARIDIERIAGEEVQLRAIRKLAEWHGFRRIHAPRARLLIRP